MSSVLVSMIIPHYNDSVGLRRILNQVIVDERLEVIVIDDRSTSVDIDLVAKEFPNFTFLQNDSCNKGAGAARNVGIRHASGEYLVFCDSDDMLTFDGCSLLIKDATESSHDIILYPPLSSLGNEGKSRVEKYRKLFISDSSPKFISDRMLVPWSKLIRAEIVHRYNLLFDEVLVSNDLYFGACISHYADIIKKSNESFYTVEEKSEGLTKKRDVDSLITRVKILNKLNCFHIENKNLHACNLKYVPLLRLFKSNPLFAIACSFPVLVVLFRWLLSVVKVRK